MHIIPRQAFNDDDVYVYDPVTLIVVQQIPCSRRDACMQALSRPQAGLAAGKGLRVKELGLQRA
jgi:hypothetical protein